MRDEARVAKEAKDEQEETVSLAVPSHPKYLYVVRSTVYPVLSNAGFSRSEIRRLVLALDEACSNIIKHAYSGDTTKTIWLKVIVGGENVRIELRDSGKKVDVGKIAPRDLKDVRPGGLGTHFMNSVFDTVSYDTSGSEGTLLTLTKKRS